MMGMTTSPLPTCLIPGRIQVALWRERFAQAGLGAIEKDLPRGGRPTDSAKEAQIVQLTTQSKPEAATHWSTRSLAKVVGVAAITMVHRVWRKNGLKPHLERAFKVSRDLKFVEKLEDIVGLYMSPPEHALVLCCDEKSQMQALDRTQPGLPMKKGRAATMTHDYKRNGTTTLFAALNVLDGQVIAQCQSRHRHTEWLKFLKQIDRQTPKDKALHLIVDNYATHKHPVVAGMAGEAFSISHALHADLGVLAEHGRAVLSRHLGESPAPWRVHQMSPELVNAIDEYIAHHNTNPKPFIWTKSARDILQKVIRANSRLSSKQNEALH